MVAVVILSTSMLATYSWINQSVEMLRRSDQMLIQELALSEVLEQVRLNDFDDQDSGEFSRGQVTINWEARPLEQRDGRNNRNIRGFYVHTLFDLSLEVQHELERARVYSTRVVRSKLVRQPQFSE
ncbi:MAG: hypothetical protein JJ956_09385 [Pseudomonadales bacterium]|nr:hypothetical protein [Pseudomonadales bacterium]